MFQMTCKSFHELLNQLESDDKLTESGQSQLMTYWDRNGQINGSNGEIFSLFEKICRAKIRSLVRSNQRDKILLLPPRSVLWTQVITGCN